MFPDKAHSSIVFDFNSARAGVNAVRCHQARMSLVTAPMETGPIAVPALICRAVTILAVLTPLIAKLVNRPLE